MSRNKIECKSGPFKSLVSGFPSAHGFGTGNFNWDCSIFTVVRVTALALCVSVCAPPPQHPFLSHTLIHPPPRPSAKT
jgi:hypothetical protein